MPNELSYIDHAEMHLWKVHVTHFKQGVNLLIIKSVLSSEFLFVIKKLKE